jgi:hypothetical protein
MRPTDAKENPGRPRNRLGSGALGLLAFFVSFFLYIWLRIEPGLLLHATGPLFFLSDSFWNTFSSRPGGLLDYAAAFLAQSDHFNWLGALVLTGICFLIFLISRRLVTLAGGAVPWTVLVLPSLGLLLGLNQYQTSAWNLPLGLLLSLAAAWGWFLVPGKWVRVRLISCWLIAAVICRIAGLWPCVSYLVIIALINVRQRRGCGLVFGCLLPGILPLLWTIWSTGNRRPGFLNPWDSGSWLFIAITCSVFLPVVLAAETLFPETPAPAPEPPARHRKKAVASVSRRRWNAPRLRRVVVTILFVAACVSVWFAFDEQRKLVAQIDYYSSHEDYRQVLALARGLKTMPPSTEVNVQFALWKEGQLLENLFSFRTQSFRGLFPGLSSGVLACRSQVEPLMEMGLVNDAEHYGQEALENEGDRPDLLRQLAQINVLKGRPQAARVFLNVLGEIPFEGDKARSCLLRLEQDPTLKDDPQLARIRPLMLTNDLGHDGMMTGPLLQHLLRANNHNRMAFEYLTVHHLLNLDLDQLLRQLSLLDELGYTGIPRHYEEAILLFQQIKNVQVQLRGRQIRPETVERFQRFTEAERGLSLGTPEGRAALARGFGDTYWFYYLNHQADDPTQN